MIALRYLALLGLAGVLAACEGDRKGDPNLTVACALRACECVPDDGPFGSSDVQPVLWRQNGDAYCQENYVLRLGDEPEREVVTPSTPRSQKKNRDGGIRLEVPLPSF